MGDIADMHVEAFQAGLDPNEMDGADWADFYDENAPLTIIDRVDGLGVDARMMLCMIDDARGEDDGDVSPGARASTLNLYVPGMPESECLVLVKLLSKLSDAANAEGDRLRAEGSTQ